MDVRVISCLVEYELLLAVDALFAVLHSSKLLRTFVYVISYGLTTLSQPVFHSRLVSFWLEITLSAWLKTLGPESDAFGFCLLKYAKPCPSFILPDFIFKSITSF